MRIGLATTGMLKVRPAIETLFGGKAVIFSRSLKRLDLIAGWGHKTTADPARQFANTEKIPYVAFEEGLLGHPCGKVTEIPYTMIVDRTGIYYDSRSPNDFEMYIRRVANVHSRFHQAEILIHRLRTERLTKYNAVPIKNSHELGLRSNDKHDRVLVVDQTYGDASVIGALCDEVAFERMFRDAVLDNIDREIIVKIHPKVKTGEKKGYLSEQKLDLIYKKYPELQKYKKNICIVAEQVNPWCLLEECEKVYCVSSQMGFEAVMAGCKVYSYGNSFYSGFGLTKDSSFVRFKGTMPRALEVLVTAFYFYYMFIPVSDNTLTLNGSD